MLTDEEIRDIRNRAKLNSNMQIDPLPFARDVIKALLAKAMPIPKQEPVAKVTYNNVGISLEWMPCFVDLKAGDKLYSEPQPAQAAAIPDNAVTVLIDDLKRIHRDLDACQKVIWLAGGFDPAYCADAQESLKLIDSMLSASPKPE